MNPEPRRIHTLGKPDLLWLLAILFGIGIAAAFAGFDLGISFLAGASGSMIALTASTFREGKNERSYWPTIALYTVLHLVFLGIVGGNWIPTPAVAIAPIFIFDYLAMSFAFPRISGITFDLN